MARSAVVKIGRGSALARLPALAAQELIQLEADLGGRPSLIRALTFAPLTRDLQLALGVLADPDNHARTLPDICHTGGILPGQLVDALAQGTQIRARILAQSLIGQRLPAVVADVMTKAAPHEQACPDCLGTGSLVPEPTRKAPNPVPGPCPTCRGGGQLVYDADPTCRELALDMGGMLPKSAGVQVAVNQQVGVRVGPSAFGGFEQMQEAVDQILYGIGPSGDVVEGDVTETDPDPAPDPGSTVV